MNKYQEALNQIKHELYAEEDDYNVSLMQELVDKETPKKPLPPKDTFFLHQCPNCKVDFIGSSIDRCQCGQKIDWTNDEPTK